MKTTIFMQIIHFQKIKTKRVNGHSTTDDKNAKAIKRISATALCLCDWPSQRRRTISRDLVSNLLDITLSIFHTTIRFIY